MSAENEILIWKLIRYDVGLIARRLIFERPVNSLDDASKLIPGGAYTTLRTYSHTKVMRIEDHFLRLEESARKASPGFQPQAAIIRPALKQVLNESPYAESRLRVTLDLENDPGTFYVTLEKLTTPPREAYTEGVKAVSRPMHRENPKAKLTSFLKTASNFRAKLPQGVNEMLMVDQNGVILEGLSSNFYGILNGTIYTVEEGVLLGITRNAVLEIIKANQIPVTFKGIQISLLKGLEECFITSASRGILPVVQINKTNIGSGKPGNITLNLIQLFNLWIEKTVEEI